MNAIKNGKYDIREGYPFPENKSDGLNNACSESFLKSGANEETAEVKDKNDVNNMEEKFQEQKVMEINNKGIIPAYVTDDIAKHGTYRRNYVTKVNQLRPLHNCSSINKLYIN